MSEWTSISDDFFPTGPVLVYVDSGDTFYMLVAEWIAPEDGYDGFWCLPVAGDPVTGVTHWMPLPDPPGGISEC